MRINRLAGTRRILAMAVAGAALGFAGQTQAQVTFSIPADAVDGGLGYSSILQVTGAGGIGDQQAARNALQGNTGTRTKLPNIPQINLRGDGGPDAGRYPNDILLPGGDDKSYLIRGNLNIPAAGTYTFNINSDDGFTMAIRGGTVPFANPTNASVESYNGNANGAFQYFGGRGASDSLAQVTFPSAGAYHFDLTYHDGCCDDSIDVSIASAATPRFDPAIFSLLGTNTATTANVRQRRAGIISSPFQVAAVHGNNSQNLADAIADIGFVAANGGAAPPPRAVGLTPVANVAVATKFAFSDPQNVNNGNLGSFQTFPGDGPGDDNNFSFGASATLTIPAGQGGHYSFLVFSDDSSRTRLIGPGGIPVTLLGVTNGTAIDTNNDGINDAFTNDPNCCGDMIGRYDLAPGNYTLESIVNEQGGGAGLFVLGALGDQTEYNAGFQVIGSNIDDFISQGGNYSFVPEPGTFAALGVVGLAALRRGRRRA